LSIGKFLVAPVLLVLLKIVLQSLYISMVDLGDNIFFPGVVEIPVIRTSQCRVFLKQFSLDVNLISYIGQILLHLFAAANKIYLQLATKRNKIDLRPKNGMSTYVGWGYPVLDEAIERIERNVSIYPVAIAPFPTTLLHKKVS